LLTYPASIPLSTANLTHLSDLLRSARRVNRTPVAAPGPGTPGAAGAGASAQRRHLRPAGRRVRHRVATVYRYIREALDLLAAQAPSLQRVVSHAARLLWVILDGTLFPIDRVADQRPHYSGKHKRHGVNVQVLADTRGRLLWASPALPGAVHDVKAARTHSVPAALVMFGVACLADNAYRGAGPTIAVPFRRGPRPLSEAQRQVNASHARNRGPGERAMATLKTWKLLTKLRCSPHRTTVIIAAIRVLQAIEDQRK